MYVREWRHVCTHTDTFQRETEKKHRDFLIGKRHWFRTVQEIPIIVEREIIYHHYHILKSLPQSTVLSFNHYNTVMCLHCLLQKTRLLSLVIESLDGHEGRRFGLKIYFEPLHFSSQE